MEHGIHFGWEWGLGVGVVGDNLHGLVAILPNIISNAFSSKELYRNLIQISLKFVTDGPINNSSLLVYAKIWCRAADKQMMTRFTGAHMKSVVPEAGIKAGNK